MSNPFEAIKGKGFTRIVFKAKERWRYFAFILFLCSQPVILWSGSFFFAGLGSLLLFSLALSILMSVAILSFMLINKSLLLREEDFCIKYSLLGIPLLRKSFKWGELSKAAVEQNRLKTHDIVFVTDKKSVYLNEALDEEESDTLLKEIQLFYHYYA